MQKIFSYSLKPVSIEIRWAHQRNVFISVLCGLGLFWLAGPKINSSSIPSALHIYKFPAELCWIVGGMGLFRDQPGDIPDFFIGVDAIILK